jgi:hypothetical protein
MNRNGQAMSSCRLIVNEDLTDQDVTVINQLHFEANKSGKYEFDNIFILRAINLFFI